MQDARRWVAEACHDIDRGDLVDSAELGVSELVTNAILHASPPLAVSLRGTHEHPRVEVTDGSPEPPAANSRMTDEDELLSTVGRGLGIVAMCSRAWGAYIHDEGKSVWFEPSARLADDPGPAGDVFRVEDASSFRVSTVDPAEGLVVRLTSLPVQVYLDYRRHYRDLRRELRLLSLAHETDYPVAKHVSDLFQRAEEELRTSYGAEEFERVLRSGVATADVTVVVPRTTPATMAQMIDMLEVADQFCRSERLLSLATTPQQNQFQRWFIGEFIRQGRGEASLPWAGSDRVKSYTPSAS